MQKNAALTLLELLTIILILSTLTLIALPNLRQQIAQARAQRVITQISNIIYAARQQAINRAVAITICPLDANNDCSANWQHGFSVFIDSEQQNKLVTQANLLQRYQVNSQQGYLTWGGFSKTKLAIKADGAMLYHNGTFTYHSVNVPSVSKKLIIGSGGRLR